MTSDSFFILGPTAAGKSSVALALARELGGVVCNLDAFQIYRGVDRGTGKPSTDERTQLPHELFDLAGTCGDFSVADYLREAALVVEKYRASGRPLIWVGGTGLYYRALRCGLSAAPATDPLVLAEWETRTLSELQSEIRRVDPAWAATADLSNPRRILRALAVYHQSGRPLSEWHRDPVEALVPEAAAYVLQVSPDRLRKKMAARVESMWQAGWPEEVRELVKITGWEGCSASRALGYAEVADWLLRGGDAAETRDRIVTLTWQYARRQLTWFRREPKLHVIEIDERSDPSLVARTLAGR
jgi:tRNA dimethylallyltransferase